MEWSISIPWNRIDERSEKAFGKVANPVRFPAKLLKEIINREVKLIIKDDNKRMTVRISY